MFLASLECSRRHRFSLQPRSLLGGGVTRAPLCPLCPRFLSDEDSLEYKYYKLKLAETQRLSQTLRGAGGGQKPTAVECAVRAMLYARAVRSLKKKLQPWQRRGPLRPQGLRGWKAKRVTAGTQTPVASGLKPPGRQAPDTSPAKLDTHDAAQGCPPGPAAGPTPEPAGVPRASSPCLSADGACSLLGPNLDIPGVSPEPEGEVAGVATGPRQTWHTRLPWQAVCVLPVQAARAAVGHAGSSRKDSVPAPHCVTPSRLGRDDRQGVLNVRIPLGASPSSASSKACLSHVLCKVSPELSDLARLPLLAPFL